MFTPDFFCKVRKHKAFYLCTLNLTNPPCPFFMRPVHTGTVATVFGTATSTQVTYGISVIGILIRSIHQAKFIGSLLAGIWVSHGFVTNRTAIFSNISLYENYCLGIYINKFQASMNKPKIS